MAINAGMKDSARGVTAVAGGNGPVVAVGKSFGKRASHRRNPLVFTLTARDWVAGVDVNVRVLLRSATFAVISCSGRRSTAGFAVRKEVENLSAVPNELSRE